MCSIDAENVFFPRGGRCGKSVLSSQPAWRYAILQDAVLRGFDRYGKCLEYES